MIRPLCIVAAAVLAGCAQQTPPTRDQALAGLVEPGRTEQPRRADTAPPPALIDNVPVTHEELHTRLAEAAGAVALEEIILDRALERAVAEAGVTITPELVDAERGVLLVALTQEARLTPEQAESMLEAMRRGRGLGPERFAALLRRNAQLRALVQPRVQVTEQEVDRAVAIEFGPRYRCRVIQQENEREAAQTRAHIEASLRPMEDFRKTPEEIAAEKSKPLPAERVEAAVALMGQWAVRVSRHETAPRGGQVAELSPADESFPASVRAMLPRLRPGEISPVIATDQGCWLVVVEEALPAQAAPTVADRARVRARVQARRERMEMDRLARELLDGATVTVFDRGLRWSWEGAKR